MTRDRFMTQERCLELALFGLAAVFFLLARAPGRPQAGFEPSARASGSLRLVSWNVGGARDGEPHGFLEAHLEAVATTLRTLEPDLVFLAEAGDEELVRRLAARLGPQWRVLRGRGGVVALATAGRLEPRPAPLARSLAVELSLAGRRVAIAALHASAFSARDRNREIGPTLDALLEQEADAHLLVGDLNLDLDRDKRADLFSNDEYLDVETYNYVVESLIDAARDSGPTAEPDRRLDYVFVSRGVTVLAAGPWRGRRSGSMDHDPLVADLEWP